MLLLKRSKWLPIDNPCLAALRSVLPLGDLWSLAHHGGQQEDLCDDVLIWCVWFDMFDVFGFSDVPLVADDNCEACLWGFRAPRYSPDEGSRIWCASASNGQDRGGLGKGSVFLLLLFLRCNIVTCRLARWKKLVIRCTFRIHVRNRRNECVDRSTDKTSLHICMLHIHPQGAKFDERQKRVSNSEITSKATFEMLEMRNKNDRKKSHVRRHAT